MVLSKDLAFGANVALGVFLLALGILILRRSPDRRSRVPLALYLGLVGLNYSIDGLGYLANAVGADPMPFRYVALLPTLLDPPLLLFFALAITRTTMRPLFVVLAFAPSAILATMYLAAPPASPFIAAWTTSAIPGIVPSVLANILLACYYASSFIILARAYFTETRTLQRDRLAVLFIGFGVVVLPRIALLPIDFGLRGNDFGGVTIRVILLATLAGILYLAALESMNDTNRAHVNRSLGALMGLLAAVTGTWILSYVPILSEPLFSLSYSIRWFIFIAVYAGGIRRYDLLELNETGERRMRGAFLGAIAALAVTELAAVFAHFEGMDGVRSFSASLALVGTYAGAHLALQRANPEATGDIESRRLAVYRAHVELGEPAGKLEIVRERLGIPAKTAREIRAVVQMEHALVSQRKRVTLEEGHVFADRYEIRSFLGVGTFGRTFLAWDRVERVKVVLKELLPSWHANKEALAAFRQEAGIAVSVRHPNLVPFHALESVPGGHVLVLGHVAGDTLHRIVRNGGLPAPEAARVMGGILDGLDALHQRGVIHRDVKPENVIVQPDGSAVLLDFGAASVAGARGTEPAGRERHPGTPAFMSPEQARGGTITAASDLYAAGAVMWETFTGLSHPFGEVPEEWKAIIARAMEADPADRWEDAGAMARAIRSVKVE